MKNRKSKIILLITLLCVTLIVLMIIYMTKKNTSSSFVSKKANLTFKNRVNDIENYPAVDHFVVGWLQVQGTNIDFPVLDNEEVNGETVKGIIWRSTCYQTGENNEFIGGHNVINVSSSPLVDMSNLTNFEGLMAFTYENFAKENLYISYTKNGKEYLYKIFAAGFYNPAEVEYCSVKTNEESKSIIEKAKKHSIFDYDVDVNENDSILSLGTCTRYFGVNYNTRFVISAREVRENEKIETYNVTPNENFNELSKGVGKEIE